MKSPHNQRPDEEARQATEEFIEKHARLTKAAKAAKEKKKASASEEQVSA
jgi:myo-inositol-1-phosphate synthase